MVSWSYSAVFLYFSPVPHEIEYDANYWLPSEARWVANGFYKHHLCACAPVCPGQC